MRVLTHRSAPASHEDRQAAASAAQQWPAFACAPTDRSGCVLGDAVAERPVFLFHLDEGDENIFQPDLQRSGQPFGDRLVERLLLRHRASLVEEYLHHDQIVGAVDAEIVRIENKILDGVLTDDLEMVVFGNTGVGDHGFIDDLSGLLPVGDVFSLLQVDTYQGHRFSPSSKPLWNQFSRADPLLSLAYASIEEYVHMQAIVKAGFWSGETWQSAAAIRKAFAIARLYARRRGACRNFMILHW